MSKKKRSKNGDLSLVTQRGSRPEALTLGSKRPMDYLPVHVAGSANEYRLPLMSSLSVADVMDFNEAAGGDGSAFTMAFYRFACRYIPKDVICALPMSDLGTLAEAWAEAGDAGKS